MATPKKYRVEECIVTIQWNGTWDAPYYSSANQNGFPGIQVPASLIAVAAKVQGLEFLIDLDKGKWTELRIQVGLLFAYHTKGKGPAEGGEWALLGTGDPTTSGHVRWVPGGTANGLAYAVGKTTAPPDYVAEYSSPPNLGRANFLILFVLKEQP